MRLASPTADAGDELPLRILVIGDAACRRLEAPLGERDPLPLRDGVAQALAALNPILTVDVADLPASGLRWTSAGGMSAGDVIAGVPAMAAGWKRRQALLGAGGCDRAAADVEIALLGAWLSAQVEAILRLPQVARCDALWRTLTWLSALASEAQGVDLHLLPATREEIEEDLGDAPDPAASGLWRTVYDLEFGQHGGRPWSALLICGMPIGPSARDLALLR
ncbi:MAG: type VI secretion system contractile sheath large subunit, partial [Planctomycetes bacterium]|nr:type VI secretion system contractile sheath large subunit [Planctomycetota bacterium]